MAHSDAVIHGDGVELAGDAAGVRDLSGHQLAQVFQMHMAGYKLGIGIGDGYDGLAEILVGHACGAPQAAGAGHIAAVGGGAGSVLGHEVLLSHKAGGIKSLTHGT